MAASGNDRGELEKTVVVVAHKIAEDKGQGQAVLAALPTAKDVDAKCSLLSVLGKIGDEKALPVLRESLGDKEDKIKDAAVRALSDWPTAAPAADLLKVAQTFENPGSQDTGSSRLCPTGGIEEQQARGRDNEDV